MPLPIVFATARPCQGRKAARKLQAAAHKTASLGDRTRVETTVAMLFAESVESIYEIEDQCYEDRNQDKQNVGAHRRVGPPHYCLLTAVAQLGAFQNNGLEHVGGVLGLVRGHF